MSPRFRFPIWLWTVLAVSTAVSVWVSAERYKDETANRAVHLLIDMPDVRLLAGSTGKTVPEVLERLKSSGATAVALAEETFDDLVATGRMVVEPGNPVRYRVTDPTLEGRLDTFVSERLAEAAEPVALIEFGDGSTLPMGTRFTDMRTFGLGFNAQEAATVRAAGLGIVGRITNQPLSDASGLRAVLDDAQSIGAEGIIFGGDQVLGRRDLLAEASQQIRERRMWIGPVEFTVQGGLPRITKELQASLIRVHSMVASEMERNEPPDIIDRYVRSVVERSMKALFLRPISMSSEDPLEGFAKFIGTIKDRLAREGYQAKPARPEVPNERPLWAAIVIGLGIAAAGGFLAKCLGGPRWGFGVGTILAGLAVSLAVGFGLRYLALAGAMIFPTLAMLAAFDKDNRGGGSGKWVGAFVWITCFSLIGGLHVAAMLTTPAYMLRIEQFFGVKLAHFLPPIFIALYLVFTENNARALLQGTVRWMDVVIMVLIMAAIFVMLTRTGNDNPGDVSAFELKMRNFLDRVLPERPRTKEFMIGHPALIVSLWMAAPKRRAWLPLLAFMAAIGQVSVLNTFCHLHTPIIVSLLRVAVGVVMGGIFGLLTLWFAQQLANRRQAA